jgi:hypothetical protein
MPTFYVDPGAAGPGDGTLSNPFNSWTRIAWSPGNTYLQKRGTVYAGVFRLAASGTRLERITVGAYYREDGSDDPSQPRPVILLPGRPVTPQDGGSIAVFGQERDFITYRDLDIRNPDLPEASDVAIIWLGHGCVVENIALTSNCAGVHIFEKNEVTVRGCALDVVACGPAHANHRILVAGNTGIDDIRITGNTVYHRGGGSPASHGIRTVSGHTIRRNICRYNYNYGGPVDNGSEGVGIGLDDGVIRCAVYWNHIANNEGNGIQVYGGGAPGSIPDTGGHTIAGNLLDTNCTYAVIGRRSGLNAPSRFYAHIQLDYIYGSRTLVTSNILARPTRAGVYVDRNSSNVVAINNVYWGTPFPLTAADSGDHQGPAAGLPVADVL